MNRLIDMANQLQRMKAGEGAYPDDDILLMPRSEGARLMELDMSIHHSTAKPEKLLKNDGTIVTQIVESVRKPTPRLECSERFLQRRDANSNAAILPERKRDPFQRLHRNIDWCSSTTPRLRAEKHLGAGFLVTAMGHHYSSATAKFI